AEMLKVNGAIDEVVLLFKSLETWSIVAILFVIVAISIFGTEIMSNTALVTVFIPVIAQFATNANFPVLQLCLPVALSASCAFMLPVGTPPNAIVFSSGQVTVKQMARNGLFLNVLAVLTVVAFSILFLK
ncbi:MAG: anion permease, partial [Crocinitomicaceae bacterium]|nr:anion permease [Crocinitomicaceae bacterium]